MIVRGKLAGDLASVIDRKPSPRREAKGRAQGRTSSMMDDSNHNLGARRWWYLLLLVQFVAVLWVPFYNSVEPMWQGIPFFYWYQFLWIIIGAILTAIVYFATE
jgi:Protein of unknown function (DUF3311)